MNKPEIIIEKIFESPYAKKYYSIYPFKPGDKAKLRDGAVDNHPQMKNITFTIMSYGDKPLCQWFGPSFNFYDFYGDSSYTYKKDIYMREQNIPAQALILL